MRTVSILVPYMFTPGGLEIYLQKRSKDAKRLPDFFGFFGGGAEDGETPEQTLIREIKEEMSIDLVGYTYFRTYEFRDIKAVLSEPKLIDEDKVIINDVFRSLGNHSK